jgi:LDH2 family malate/lactate/ureidoglycolate dehydrogenase
MATSARAEGKIRVRRNRNEKVPKGWLLDKEGNPTENPHDLYDGGSMLPFGDEVAYKAMGLGMVVDFLGGALTESGCSSSEEYRTPGGSNGTFIIVINIPWFTPVEDFKRRTDEVIDNVKNVKKQQGVDEIFVAGEIEGQTKEKRLAEGIYISEVTWESIKTIAEDNGLSVENYVKLM